MLDYATFPEQRQSLIRQLLEQKGRVVCTELALQLNVSEHTIRRDLKELARDGICKRVYGGAVNIIPVSTTFTQRTEQYSAEQSIISARCAQLIKEDSCIFIDAGSTNLLLAKAIPDNLSLTVVTNSPLIAIELARHSSCEVIILGGKMHKHTGGSLGLTAQRQLEQIYFDQSFLGGCALDAEIGLTVFSYEDAEFKQALIKQSNEIITAMTSDKIPGVARYSVTGCDNITSLVISKNLSADIVTEFINKDMNIILAS